MDREIKEEHPQACPFPWRGSTDLVTLLLGYFFLLNGVGQKQLRVEREGHYWVITLELKAHEGKQTQSEHKAALKNKTCKEN